MEVVTPETYFDLASVTKVFVATLFARLVDRGWVGYETPVSRYFPSLDPRIEARHLLSHTAGLIAYQEFFREAPLARSLAERRGWMRDQILGLRPTTEPGTKTLYSDPSFILLGFLVEEVTNRSLDEAMKSFVLDPMGLDGVGYGAAPGQVASTEDCPWRHRVISGEVHDENAWILGGVAGHAGIFARAGDVIRFAEGLFGQFLSPRVSEVMWRPFPPENLRTLGWDLASALGSSLGRARESLFCGRAVGHLGYTGTSVWMNPERRIAVTLLTNRVHPTRANESIKQWRPKIHEAIAQDLGCGEVSG